MVGTKPTVKKDALMQVNITVNFLCPEYVKAKYAKSMMGRYKTFWHPDVNNIGTIQKNDRGETLSVPGVLADGKVKDQLCERCPYGFLCTGFLPGSPRAGIKQLEDLDPEWLITSCFQKTFMNTQKLILMFSGLFTSPSESCT